MLRIVKAASSFASCRLLQSSFAAMPSFIQPASSIVGCRLFSSERGSARSVGAVALNTLSPAPGSRRVAKRLGRGVGSGKGKTAGKGHKGQTARHGAPRPGFEGGQTPLYRRVPKRGFTNPDAIFLTPLNLDKLCAFIDSGRIATQGVITMKTLFDAHICGRKINGQGIKLLGTGDKNFKHKIEVEVTRISARAKKAIEAAGGVAREVYYNDIGLRALLKPEKFEKIPARAHPPPRLASKYPGHAEAIELAAKDRQISKGLPRSL